jgi:hypothetical protein
LVFAHRFALGGPFHADAEPAGAATQWRVRELHFVAEADYADPFDTESARFVAEFRGPNDRRLTVPGFWDGGRDWRLRFTPTEPGRWEYVTSFTSSSDEGLHARRGAFDVKPAEATSSVRRHGGFLRVSEDGRHLAHPDGTPFFWLGDTWWRVPSGFVPFDDFVRMVDRRVAQGFTVFQALGYAPFAGSNGVGVFRATGEASDDVVAYWREVDRYLGYAEAKGLVGVIGLGGTSAFDGVDLPSLERLWRYYLARYSAYPITFLITQEYNSRVGDAAERFAKVRALGHLIREIDPYRRAITVHPAVASIDDLRAWSEDWYGFALLQGGHFSRVRCEAYEALRARAPTRPIIQSEHNYESFERGRFKVTADEVRRTAYSAIQCGAYGYTYGAQGLYAAIADISAETPASKWGPLITWKEGLALPGAAQLSHLRTFYESVEWWKTAPWDSRHVSGDALVRSDGYSTVVVYFATTSTDRMPTTLHGVPGGARFAYDWFDPRTGAYLDDGGTLAAIDRDLVLPPSPDRDDWLLRLRKLPNGVPTE